MTRFVDGPAKGAVLELRRAPIFLRVVIGDAGAVDALDRLEDTPGPSEKIHVYQRVPGSEGVVFLCGRGKLRSASGRYEHADYRHMPEVDGESVRSTEDWRAWASREPVDSLVEDAAG